MLAKRVMLIKQCLAQSRASGVKEAGRKTRIEGPPQTAVKFHPQAQGEMFPMHYVQTL